MAFGFAGAAQGVQDANARRRAEERVVRQAQIAEQQRQFENEQQLVNDLARRRYQQELANYNRGLLQQRQTEFEAGRTQAATAAQQAQAEAERAQRAATTQREIDRLAAAGVSREQLTPQQAALLSAAEGGSIGLEDALEMQAAPATAATRPVIIPRGAVAIDPTTREEIGRGQRFPPPASARAGGGVTPLAVEEKILNDAVQLFEAQADPAFSEAPQRSVEDFVRELRPRYYGAAGLPVPRPSVQGAPRPAGALDASRAGRLRRRGQVVPRRTPSAGRIYYDEQGQPIPGR